MLGKFHRLTLGYENPNISVERERNSPKLNAWSGLLRRCNRGPFSFAEKTINGDAYRNLLEFHNWNIYSQMFYFSRSVLHLILYVNYLIEHLSNGGLLRRTNTLGSVIARHNSNGFILWGYVK
ncbi:hypothetical protein AVEN_46352-1 [Araneus ventricosus]|uniref:Uncharacterized protein n=1 Tax=Araneus ventricosus TaxID=182803 RepID=A0A4Y2NT58_ARAVE|nr:hypothetical protein AVEN_46352-1 [Araneus ventricosus]